MVLYSYKIRQNDLIIHYYVMLYLIVIEWVIFDLVATFLCTSKYEVM